MLNKKFISTICALALASSLSAKEFNLDELIEIALENNTNIQISKNTKDIRKEEVNKAVSGYLPKVSASSNIGQYDIDASGVKQDGDANATTISASQLIYDFGKTTSSIDQSKYNLEASSSDIITKRQNTILSIKEAYYDILNKYQQINVSKESVALNELQLDQAQSYFEAGVKTQIDVTNAKLNLSNAKLDLVKANYDLEISKASLISILGVDKEENIDVSVDGNDITKLANKVSFQKEELIKLIEIGIQKRPELEDLKAQIKASQESIKTVNSQYFPTIDVQAAYTDQNSDDISSLDTDQGSITLNLKWDIYTGNSTNADKKIALSNLSTAKSQLHQQKLEIKQAITDAYFNLRQSYDSIEISLLSLKLATENLDLANQRYIAGLNDLLEVNDAKLEYTKAKSSLVNTYYEHLTNNAKLEFALGK